MRFGFLYFAGQCITGGGGFPSSRRHAPRLVACLPLLQMLTASFIITVLSASMLRIAHMREKWERKLQVSRHSERFLSRTLFSPSPLLCLFFVVTTSPFQLNSRVGSFSAPSAAFSTKPPSPLAVSSSLSCFFFHLVHYLRSSFSLLPSGNLCCFTKVKPLSCSG